ncbi:EcsC protein family [uncultured Clostridium sp.]|uniref:EcsC family protein n=1 Tax=uncultured Clostridium sp. TaxID=59620 RepID=UPI0008224C32|nr:EcsC family protein [uncultured Clostridium sp.]SCJ99783.1 EcsC protein family [uncultured Clostridium sp.]
MSKERKINNLINKQIKLIEKKEAKLLKEPKDNYIKAKILPIKEKIEYTIPDKLISTLEIAFQKGFKTVFDKGVGIIEKTYNKEEINMEYDINAYAVNKYPTKKNFKKIDKSASKKTLVNKSITVLEGSGLGVLGIGLPDVPLYIAVILKSIYEISLSYGFDYSSEAERAYILTIISSAVTKGEKRVYYFNKLDIIANEIDNNTICNYDIEEILIDTSSKMSTYMLTSKFIQGLPIVGVVGGVTNFIVLQDITDIAKVKYKKRYLSKL